MRIERLIDTSSGVVPLIAALPFSISVENDDDSDYEPSLLTYDAKSQQTVYGGRGNYSTSREDDSVWKIFSTKSDTKKDD